MGRASKAGTPIIPLLSATHEGRFLDEVTEFRGARQEGSNSPERRIHRRFPRLRHPTLSIRPQGSLNVDRERANGDSG
jgi:hypothetical protein